MSDPRLTTVEILLTHQEKKIEELSEMMTQQWAEIERLKTQLSRTLERVETMETSGKDPKSEAGLDSVAIAALNKPPHY